MKIHTKKLLSVLLTVMMLFTIAIPAFAAANAPDKALELIPYDASQMHVKHLGETSAVVAEAEKHDPDEIVRVSIILSGKSTLDAGFSTEKIAFNRSAVAYRNTLKAQQAKMTAKIEKAIEGKLAVKHNLTLAINAISADVRWGDLRAIEMTEGVETVEIETRYEPLTVGADDPNMAVSIGTVGSEAAWAEGYYGAGSRIAIVDTGLTDTHQSVDPDAFDYAIAEDAANAGISVEDYNLLDAEEIAEVLDQLNADVSAEELYLNSKIPFHYNYIDGGTRTTHNSDDNSDHSGNHGSHVAGIAAANRYIEKDGSFVDAKEEVMAVGNAPDAQLLIMKVFGIGGGAYDSDYMAAIEDAIVLGADSVNLSLGSGNPGSVFAGTYQSVMDKLEASNTVYCGSAGNSYAWDYALTNDYGIYADSISLATSGSPSTYTNSLSIAASQNVGSIGKPLVFGDINAVFTETSNAGGSISRLEGNTYDFVYIDGVGNAEEYEAVNAEISLEGKAVITNRGSISFYVKGNNLIDFAPAFLIVANNQPGSINMALDDYVGSFPMVAITLDDANAIKAQSDKTTVGGYDVYTGSVNVSDKLIAMPSGFNTDPTDFSSWGPTGALTLKPEITAPGGNIRSISGYGTEDGVAYSGGDDTYELMSGTSMASPQVAGLVAVLAQYIRENGLEEKTGLTRRQLMHSLLMSTAEPMHTSDGSYYPVMQQGSGLANVQNAIDAESYILMNASATASYADGKVKAELGQNASRDGEYAFSFNIYNTADENKTFTLSADLFTQAIEEGYYDYVMSHDTEAIDADVEFLWTTVEADVNIDGATDYADVQAILDKLTGKYEGEFDAEAADLDGDGTYTSKDAYILLDKLTNETEGVVLANDFRTVSVTIKLSDEQKAYFDETRLTAYVEGFVYANSEGDVTHSIPMIGVYGSWTDSSMFDAVTAFDAFNNFTRESYSGNYDTNGFVIKKGVSSYFFTGNPYMPEPDADPAKFAVSGKATIASVRHTLIRNAATMIPVIFDGEGNILWSGAAENDVYGMYYYVNGAQWRNNGVSTTRIAQKIADLGLTEGDNFEVKFFAVPEYYALMLDPTATSGALDLDTILDLYDQGEIGEGATLSMAASIDSKAPSIIDAYLSADGKTLTVTADDNNYIAYVALMDIDGKVAYAATIPEMSRGSAVKVELDISNVDTENMTAAAIFVGDYAANEDARLIRFKDGPIIASKTVYALTNTLEEGKQYIISDTNAIGTGAALLSSGPVETTGAVSGMKEISIIEDLGNICVDPSSVEDLILWQAADDSVALQNVGDGSYLGYYQTNFPFVTWSNAGYADAFIYDAPTMYVNNTRRFMSYDSGYFMYGTTRGNIYLYTPTEIEYEIDPEAAASVTVDPTAATLILGVTPTIQLDYTIAPIVLDDKTVTWTSSDETVATVNAEGLVTAVAEGTAIIRAASNKTPDVYGECRIAVTSETPIDAVVYAQTTYGKDDMRFEQINLNDMSTTQIAEAGSTFISGGLSGDYIWGTDTDIDVMRYDIATFTPQMMFSLNPTYLPLDSANFPSFSITVPAAEEGGEDTVYDFDYLYASVTKNGWFTMWTGDTGSNASYFDLGSNDLNLVALAFCGTYYDEEANEQQLYYYAIDAEGTLYLLYIYNEDDGLSIGAAPLGTVDVLTMGDDPTAFSMAYIGYQTDSETILIADNNMKAIFSVEVDLNANTNASAYVGKLDASSIAGLFNADFDTVGQLSAAEQQAYQSVLTNAKTFSAQTISTEELSNDKAYAPRVSNVMNVPAKSPAPIDANIDLTIAYAEDEDVTNGLVTVTYDPEKLTYTSADIAIDEYTSLNVDEEAGTITFAYATLDAIAAGENIAVFHFTYNCEESKVTLTVSERNDELDLEEEVSTVIPGTGHDYEVVEWNWDDEFTSATVSLKCAICGDETTAEAEISEETTAEATCEEDGVITVTATATVGDQTFTDVQEKTIPATGHDWQLESFEWTDENTAVAKFVCANNAEHTREETAEITSEETPAGCEEDGEIIYTATVTIDGKTYTDTKSETIPATGHDYSEGSQCANCGAWAECPYCGEHHNENTISGWWTALIHHILYIINRIFLWWSPIAK